MNEEPYPAEIRECMDSWEKHLLGYKIFKWDADNFDVHRNIYTEEAMKSRKYAFVTDYIRLYALYNYGGIYLDTDVKVLHTFDDLLKNKSFVGFQSREELGTCLLASEKKNPLYKELLDCYKTRHFIKPDGSYDMTPNPRILAPVFEKYGVKLNGTYQKLDWVTVYPIDFFCPLYRGELNITDNTYSIHLFHGSWLDIMDQECIKFRHAYLKRYKQRWPDFVAFTLARAHSCYDVWGIKGVLRKIVRKLLCK